MKRVTGIKMVAGCSFIGFAAVSILADRVKLGPVASQVAGFAGAFLGGLAANQRSRHKTHAFQSESAQQVQSDRDDSG
jgi:uncharacterized membrane protein YeaQ/YmgE (transglycosylase-associated protein family)